MHPKLKQRKWYRVAVALALIVSTVDIVALYWWRCVVLTT